MEETFEANTQDDYVKEWMVEFVAMVNGDKHHHLSVLYGTDQQDVQRAGSLEAEEITLSQKESIELSVVLGA